MKEERHTGQLLEEYLITYEYFTEKIERLDERIEELSCEENYREKVKKPGCLLGVKTHTALSMVVEAGDFERFAKPEKFAAFLGLVPSEETSDETSDEKQNRYGITKAGDSHLRRRFHKMTMNKRLNGNVATTAMARELACFMWGLMTDYAAQWVCYSAGIVKGV